VDGISEEIIMFKLEEYLKQPRTFKGPLTDYVHQRQEKVLKYSHYSQRLLELASFEQEMLKENLAFDLAHIKGIRQ
jgi:hypothetical protein